MFEDIQTAVDEAVRRARETNEVRAVTVKRWTPGVGMDFTYNVWDVDTANEYVNAETDAFIVANIKPRDRGHAWRTEPNYALPMDRFDR